MVSLSMNDIDPQLRATGDSALLKRARNRQSAGHEDWFKRC